ncbi:MAG: LysR family transcriptional regulator [Flavobacteriales bacterium]|nr:LysR family transcriptional regulator [Flavobacteriales bacterium]
MTIPQLEYIVALDTTRHFSKAAALCFVTQPTLSMQIQKLEGKLGLEIFDRSRQPVKPTATGMEIIAKAREMLNILKHIPEIVDAAKGQLAGTFRLGIIPTIAPALLARFLRKFVQHYPLVKLEIEDMQTSELVEALRSDRLDAGIVAIPL